MYCHIHHCHCRHCKCVPIDSKEKGEALTQEELLALTEEMKDELKGYTVDLKDQIFSYIDIGVNPVEIANTFASLKEQDTYILRTLTNKIDELNNTSNLSMFNLRARVTDLEGQSATLIQDLTDRTQRIEVLESNLSTLPFEDGTLTDTLVVVDGSLTQRTINKGLESLADLSTINNPKDGLRVYVKSYHAGLGIGGGDFIYDSGKANINDGGVVINGWVRQFTGLVQPEWWGAIPDGVTSCLLPMQKAINYCKTNSTRAFSASRGGSNGMYLNKGVYIIDGTLNLKQINGFIMETSSKNTAVLLYTKIDGYMFDLMSYHYVTFKGLRILNASYNASTQYTTLLDESSATAFNLSGTDGAQWLRLDGCAVSGFGTVFRSLDNQINVDKTYITHTSFSYIKVVWDNYNFNAVGWTFDNCSFFGYDIAFKNPTNSLRVTNCLSMGNTFWFADSTSPALNSDITFRDIRFESHLNIDPTASPMYFDVKGLSTGVIFENCTMLGIIPTINNMTTARMNSTHYQDIKMINCHLYGVFELISSWSGAANMPRLTIENCSKVPTFDISYTANSGNKAANLILKDYWVDKYGRVDRNFYKQRITGGAGGGGSAANKMQDMTDVFFLFGLLDPANDKPSISRELSVFTVDPYKLMIARVSFYYNITRPQAGSLTINLYTDSSKSTLMGTTVKEIGGSKSGVVTLEGSDILNNVDITESSAPLFVEAIADDYLASTYIDIAVSYALVPEFN